MPINIHFSQACGYPDSRYHQNIWRLFYPRIKRGFSGESQVLELVDCARRFGVVMRAFVSEMVVRFCIDVILHTRELKQIVNLICCDQIS